MPSHSSAIFRTKYVESNIFCHVRHYDVAVTSSNYFATLKVAKELRMLSTTCLPSLKDFSKIVHRVGCSPSPNFVESKKPGKVMVMLKVL